MDGLFSLIFKGFAVLVTVLALIGTVVYVGYLGGWWLTADSTNRNAVVQQHSYAFQQARMADVHKDVTALTTLNAEIANAKDTAPDQVAPLATQRHALLNDTCAAAALIDTVNMPTDLAPFLGANCLAGAAAPNATVET